MFYLFSDNHIGGNMVLYPYEHFIVEAYHEDTASEIIHILTSRDPNQLSECGCDICNGKTYYRMNSNENLLELTSELMHTRNMRFTRLLLEHDIVFMLRLDVEYKIESWYNLHNLQTGPF